MESALFLPIFWCTYHLLLLPHIIIIIIIIIYISKWCSWFSKRMGPLTKCRVIRKFLRDFQPLRYSSRNSHAEGEHINM
jgi:hypothetical protein